MPKESAGRIFLKNEMVRKLIYAGIIITNKYDK
jgi:hypothetical protein